MFTVRQVISMMLHCRHQNYIAVWALCLSLLSVLYSAGWLWWASTQGPLFG